VTQGENLTLAAATPNPPLPRRATAGAGRRHNPHGPSGWWQCSGEFVLGTAACPLSIVLHGGREGCLAACPNVRLAGGWRSPPRHLSRCGSISAADGGRSTAVGASMGQSGRLQGRSDASHGGGVRCGTRHALATLASVVGHRPPPPCGGPSSRGSGML
jgi:hypothetical protein